MYEHLMYIQQKECEKGPKPLLCKLFLELVAKGNVQAKVDSARWDVVRLTCVVADGVGVGKRQAKSAVEVHAEVVAQGFVRSKLQTKNGFGCRHFIAVVGWIQAFICFIKEYGVRPI